MSVARLAQGCSGISCIRDVLGFCLHLEWEYFKHSSQFNVNFSSWSFKTEQYTVSLALSLHLPRPKCPSCMNCNKAWHSSCGTTIEVPFMITPSSTVSSLLKVQYGCISLGTSLMVLGHPWVMVCLRFPSSSSSWVSILIWFKLSLLAQNWVVIWCMQPW